MISKLVQIKGQKRVWVISNFVVFLLFLILIINPSYGKDYIFVLRCDYEDINSSRHPFIFIGKQKGQDSLIIYLKSDGKIFKYKGGESKNLKLTNESSQFFQYEFKQLSTPKFKESMNYFSLDRSSLRLSQKNVLTKEKYDPLYTGYTCKKELDENKTYLDSINLKKKFDSGAYNQI